MFNPPLRIRNTVTATQLPFRFGIFDRVEPERFEGLENSRCIYPDERGISPSKLIREPVMTAHISGTRFAKKSIKR
jgi:hypothetical protein